MNYLRAFRRSKYTFLFIGAVTIAIVYMLSNLGLKPLNATSVSVPDSCFSEPSISPTPSISLAPTTPVKEGIGWDISTTSGSAEIELADYLTQQDVKIYASYWCPHCHEQKQLFGQEAWNKINYIECAQDAQENPQPDLCKQAGIKGFPTWSINGELDPGVKKLAQLAELTGYQGNTAFKYDRLFSR